MEKETDFAIGDQIVRGKLILEKTNTDKNAEYKRVEVYKLDDFEPKIPFEGTHTCEIEKEFPDKKFSIGEVLDNYLMFKDGILVCDDTE